MTDTTSKRFDVQALVKELSPEMLPDAVADIADIIGLNKTLLLVQKLGGVDFAIPMGNLQWSSEQLLIDAIGESAAAELMTAYGGERLYIPRCQAACIKLRNHEFRVAIEMMVASGKTQTAAIRQYAPQYGFTERWAYKILSEKSGLDAQLSLFDPAIDAD